jgi:hypothetical protein
MKTRACVNELLQKYRHVHIDYKGLQLYYKQLEPLVDFKSAIKECIEIIDY